MHWIVQPQPMIVLGCADGNIKLVDAQSGQVKPMAQHQGMVGLEIAQINNQSYILTIGLGKELKGW